MARAKTDRQTIEVHLDAAELGPRRLVGLLHRSAARADLPASFEYDRDWLQSTDAFVLDPRLELWNGEQYPPTDRAAFGIFMDSAPDRWGRVLMERREAALASREGRKVRALMDLDFLLGVQDVTRAGALRFRSVDGPFLDDSDPAVPPVASLRELAAVSEKLESPEADKLPEYEHWLAMLMAPGTSLGGARPKANFTDDGRLWIAKFPSGDDRYDVGAWEYLLHLLAADAGVVVPPSRLQSLTDRHRTFCAVRFDRHEDGRRMFASAMTLLDRRDGQGASYLDLAEFISERGAPKHIAPDLEQLYRRVVFNVVVGNRDDHLRNHGFIREREGWRLSPAYDLNPNLGKSEHTLTLDGASPVPSLATVLGTAELYRLDQSGAQTIVNQIKKSVQKWEAKAKTIGCSRDEIARMKSVFLV